MQELPKTIAEHSWDLQSYLVARYEVAHFVEAREVAAERAGFADLDRRWAQRFGSSETVTCHGGVLHLHVVVVPDIAATSPVSGCPDVEAVVALADGHHHVVHTE